MTIPSTTSSSPTTTFTKTTLKPLEPTFDNNISCPICEINLKQTEIEKHLRQHIRNPLLKDFICDRLKIKKGAIEFDNIFYKLKDFQIRKLIETLQKYIEKYGKNDIVKNDLNSLQVWTDGSVFENGTTNARAGIGVFWKDNDIQNLSEHVPGDQTNNRAEIFAIIRAIEICNDKVKPLNIMTDSKYVINAMEY
ncbi:ribonuclease H-like protein [Gigaspora margarita]|uniref:ribonuclease H n=1 Tax=Gigaspora margarita TaxID=4874 RepID=A0A8H3XCZ8_GIGMA|nr:ribonuclease H-like protein [Gigaspora margarita]